MLRTERKIVILSIIFRMDKVVPWVLFEEVKAVIHAESTAVVKQTGPNAFNAHKTTAHAVLVRTGYCLRKWRLKPKQRRQQW